MTNRRWQLRIRELVRQFPENGMKMLLEHPANVRDLLSIVRTPWLGEIDFGRLEQIKTTFIRRDYRHLESDIVLTAPLVGPRKGAKTRLLIYPGFAGARQRPLAGDAARRASAVARSASLHRGDDLP